MPQQQYQQYSPQQQYSQQIMPQQQYQQYSTQQDFSQQFMPQQQYQQYSTQQQYPSTQQYSPFQQTGSQQNTLMAILGIVLSALMGQSTGNQQSQAMSMQIPGFNIFS